MLGPMPQAHNQGFRRDWANAGGALVVRNAMRLCGGRQPAKPATDVAVGEAISWSGGFMDCHRMARMLRANRAITSVDMSFDADGASSGTTAPAFWLRRWPPTPASLT